jgi:hypothetical protein
MNQRFSYRMMWAAGLSAFLFSCQKDITSKESAATNQTALAKGGVQAAKINTFKGPEVQIGNGMMRSFITITHSGVPQEIGLEMTAGALEGLPTEGENSYIVPLHPKAQEVTPFDHLGIGWNPFGHPPPGIYSVPHFDFHFYEISVAEQMAIPEYTTETAPLFNNYPPAGYIPAGYVHAPDGVAKMGMHWLDVLSPEFHGQTFTKTFVYGSYDGAVTFYEPMITKAYIEATASSTTPIRQPQYFSPTGTYYPTQYNVYTDAATGKHYVSLSGFVWR